MHLKGGSGLVYHLPLRLPQHKKENMIDKVKKMLTLN